MDNHHIEWIDILKGFGIIFVVLGHTLIPSKIITYIFSFHMPLFFFLSGYLFSLNKYPTFKSFFIKKSKTLLIPYFSFALISILISFFITNILLHGHINIIQDLMETIVSTRNKISYNAPLWFLTSLFCIEIIFYFMKRYIHNRVLLVITILTLSVIGFNTANSPKLPWTFDSSLFYLVYYGMGNQVNEVIKNNSHNTNKRLITFIFLLLNVNFIFNISGTNNIFLILLHNYAYSISLAIFGFTFYALISQKLFANKVLSYLGKNSLIIMSLHIVIFNILGTINSFTFQLPLSNFFGILFTVITLFVLVPIINFINCYLPFILGKNIQFKPQINKTV